jgi:hypothetical protein
MSRRKRREPEDLNMSFLDMICCGFGSMILLLMITKVVEPVLLEKSKVNLQGIVAKREAAVHDIRGESREMTRELTQLRTTLERELIELATVERDVSAIRGQYAATKSEAEESNALETRLASAKQSLTEEMERLLGADFRRSDSTIGGIPVDSEYVIFVIDTSGSMFNFAWPLVMQKVQETLAIYPEVKGIQVMNDEGGYMFPRYQGRWIPDSQARRKAIVERMRTWNPFSDSSPVEGIEAAIRTFWAPDKRVSVYVFGDDFQGRSIEDVVDTVDVLNRPDEKGAPRVRIHAVGFPTLFQADRQDSLFRFAALMRELTYRNGGAFVGLPEFQ